MNWKPDPFGRAFHFLRQSVRQSSPKGSVVSRIEDIPHFDSEEQEHQFWSTHTFSDEQMEEAEPIPADILPPPRKPSFPVSLRLDNDVVHRLRVLAAKKRMRYQTLLKQLLIERLYEEEKREGLV